MTGGRLEVADGRADDDLGAVADDQVDTAEHVSERLREPGTVGEQVGRMVIAGGVPAERVVSHDQQDVEHPEQATEYSDEGEPTGEGDRHAQERTTGDDDVRHQSERRRPFAKRAARPSTDGCA